MPAQTKRLLLLLAILFVVVPLALWALFTLTLPRYISSRLLPSLAADHGISTLQARPILIGRTGIHSGFFLGSEPSPVLQVSSLDVDYSLGALIGKQEIERITLSGVEIRCRLAGNKLLVDDARLQQILDDLQQKPATEKKSSRQNPPFSVKQIRIRQATLICRTDTERFRLPFAADMDRQDPPAHTTQLSFTITIFPREQEIRLSGMYDADAGTIHFELAAPDINPRLFADHGPILARLAPQTTINMNGSGTLHLNPFFPAELQGSVMFHARQMTHRDIIVSLDDETPFTLSFQATQPNSTEPLKFELNGSPLQLAVHSGGTKLHVHSSSFSVHGSLRPDLIDITSRCLLSLEMNHDDFQAKIPQCAVTIETKGKPGEGFRGRADIGIDAVSIIPPSGEVKISNSRLLLPFSLPFSEQTQEGKVTIEAIRWRDQLIGRFNGRINQQQKSMIMKGDFHTDFLPGARAITTMSADFNADKAKMELAVDLPLTRLHNFSLRQLLPAAADMVVSGALAAKAGMTFADDKPTGTGQITVHEGAVELAGRKTAITGIETAITFPNLPLLRSAPNQKLGFSRANIGDLQLDGGTVNFNIESPDSFFLEKATFNWAGGTISSYAMRFSEQHLQPEMVFYCNKLKLAAILSQAGIKNVEGEGTVNGRIPILFTDKKITFEPSFLYSTPGEGGVIRISGGDFLTQAIPLTNPQFGQLAFAQEALRNFSYNWAKLHLFSEDETLVMQLNLDGKPASPLPFSYDSKSGAFQRLSDKDGRTAGISHPIVLDVNFRFPLNTFLEYDKSIKDFLHRKAE